MRKIISILLAVVMAFTAFPVSAYATHTHKYSQTVKVYDDATVKKKCSCGSTKVFGKAVKTVKLKNAKLTYNGKARKVAVIAKNDAGKTIPKAYYTVKYNKPRSSRISYGKYKVTVTFKKPYKKVKTLTYYIVPENRRAYVTCAGSSHVLFSMPTFSYASGMQLQLASDKRFTKNVRESELSDSGSEVVENLKSSSRYYYRTRTYAKCGKKRYYSKWSKVRSFKTEPVNDGVDEDGWTLITENKDYTLTQKGNCYHLLNAARFNKEEGCWTTFVSDAEINFDTKSAKTLINNSSCKLKVDKDGNYLIKMYYHRHREEMKYFNENDVWVCLNKNDSAYLVDKNVFPLITDKMYEDGYSFAFPFWEHMTTEYIGNLVALFKRLNLNDTMSDFQKYIIITRWINENYEYAFKEDGITPDTAFSYANSLFKYNKSVCMGFAQFTQDICCMADIPCYYFSGGDHAWNYIKLGGYWYFVDNVGGGNTVMYKHCIYPKERYASLDDFLSKNTTENPPFGTKNMETGAMYVERFKLAYSDDIYKRIYDENIPHGDVTTLPDKREMYEMGEVARNHTFN